MISHPGQGYKVSRTISAASTNATLVKAAEGRVHGWYLSNVNAAARFLKIYDKGSAAPTPGTDTPIMTIAIPGATSGAGANLFGQNGIYFANGIGIAITGAVGDSDTTAISANEVVVNLIYS